MAAGMLGWIKPQFSDSEGVPVASGKLYSFVAGLDTPQPTYSDPDLTIANANPTLLDAAGQSATSIYLLPVGYKFRLDSAADVPLWTVDYVSDVGAVFAAGFGEALSQGSKNVVSGYTILPADRLVTVNSTGGANPCVINLLPAADASGAVSIKNLGTIALSVVVNGSDTLDGVNAAYTVPAGAPPQAPGIWIVSDTVSAWYIIASHKL
jgi:hypothetical protein